MRDDLKSGTVQYINQHYTSIPDLKTQIKNLSNELNYNGGVSADFQTIRQMQLIGLYIAACPRDSEEERVVRYVQKYMHAQSRENKRKNIISVSEWLPGKTNFQVLLIGLAKIVHVLDIRQRELDLSVELQHKLVALQSKSNEFATTITDNDDSQYTLQEWFVKEMEARIEWNAKEGVPGTSDWHKQEDSDDDTMREGIEEDAEGSEKRDEDAMSEASGIGAGGVENKNGEEDAMSEASGNGDRGVENKNGEEDAMSEASGIGAGGVENKNGEEDAMSVASGNGALVVENNDDRADDMSEGSSGEFSTFNISEADMEIYFYARTRASNRSADELTDIGMSSRIYALKQLKNAAEEAQKTLAKFRGGS
jgi:hypothetical protein